MASLRSSRPRSSFRPLTLVTLAGLLFGALYIGSLFRSTAPEPAVPAAALAVPSSEVLVQVLNESQVDRGAQRLARVLRQRGFDVVEVGNGSRVGRTETEVIVRGNDMEKGAQIARALNCRLLRSDPNPDLLLDVTVLVGQDVGSLVTLPE
ncbi:MAG: LytR C-terminal domain-containing protein [bacterium]